MKQLSTIEYLLLFLTDREKDLLERMYNDNFSGVACKKTHHDFIGIEMDDKYYQIAQDRLNNI